MFSLNGAGAFETAEFMAAHIDQFGTPEAYNTTPWLGQRHVYALPMDQAGGLSLRWDPQRGHRALANGLSAQGEVRSQFIT